MTLISKQEHSFEHVIVADLTNGHQWLSAIRITLPLDWHERNQRVVENLEKDRLQDQ